MELKTGTTLKGYRLMDRIGEGGFGVVYRAYQPVIEREVVVKAILPIYANDPTFIRNFEAEAQLIARLEHLHIVPLYDYWRDPTGAYLVMRLLKGGSLLEILRTDSLDIDMATRMLEQIAAALEVAHKNNIVHQDIKPANILLDDQENAYLSDFGIAKDLSSAINLAETDNENTVHGSPAYVAPEQITRGDVTSKADIYSLGLLMFEALVGEHPFPGSSLMELLKHQLNTPLPPLHIHRPELPEELSAILWRATTKSPDGRYTSVMDMAHEFRQVVNDMKPVQKKKYATPINRDDPSLRRVTAVINLNLGTMNPYKGLRPFEEADSTDFFGRNTLIENIVNHIRENRFLAVVGPSGSGKSSTIKAGVIPTIRRSKESPWDKTFIISLTPGNNPLINLESALLSIATITQGLDLDSLKHDTKSLNRLINQILPDQNSKILLAIDQFEEVFTQIPDEANRKHFLDLIAYAVQEEDSRLRIIVTLRADFYDRPLMYASIGDLIKNNTEVVLPLSREELQESIVGPASKAGLVFEPELVDIILDDVEKQPNALPLLQYTLTELYERRDNLKLTLKGYQSSGGITGSLARRADQLYIKMTAEERQATRELFLRLVTLGEGTEDTRRRTLRSELNVSTIEKDTMQAVLDIFSQYRLLTFDHDPETRAPTVEIAHEALIRRWDHLQRWLNENRDDLRLQRKVATATNEWIKADRQIDYLAQGARLTQFEPLLHNSAITLSTDEQNYVESSIQKRENARRRVQGFVAMLIVVSLIAVGAAIVAIIQSKATQEARNLALQERDRADEEAMISRSRELAASALVTVEQIDIPLLLSLEALTISDTFEARNSLLTTLQEQPRLLTFMSAHTDIVRTVAYSPDGNIIATGGTR